DVRGVIYCENCLAERLQDVMPPAGAQAPSAAPAGPVMVVPSSGPNPALAAVLAAFFPFGVGAVYCAQYAKGLAHMVIFAFLVWGASTDAGPAPLFGLAIAFFYIYQIVDAYRSAKALQLGQPAPDPFGLGRMVGTGGPIKMSNVPTGALVLIALGVLFLLGNLGLFEFRMFGDLVIPIFLIGLGVWIFVRRSGMVAGEPGIRCGCASCRARELMGPAVLVTLGGLLLLAAVHVVRFGRTWPVLLLVIGLIKVLQSNASSAGHLQPPPGGAQAPPPAPPAEGEVSGEVGHV
ncbi:MAG TPA: DUF5668 domain-containing protein, partial [Terriglobales bacterium]